MFIVYIIDETNDENPKKKNVLLDPKLVRNKRYAVGNRNGDVRRKMCPDTPKNLKIKLN